MGIISSAIDLAGGIWGGVQATKAANKAKTAVETQQSKNQDWYDRSYNEDATQRADAQAVLTQTEDSIRLRNKGAAGSAAVNGGTTESVAAAKAANNQALADATSSIAANAESRKDSIEATYLNNDNAFASQLGEIEANKANAIGQAVQGVSGAAANIDDNVVTSLFKKS